MKEVPSTRTPQTETSPARLSEKLQQIREQGYASIDKEVEMGLRSIAEQLTDLRQRTVAALNVGFAVTIESMETIMWKYLPALKVIQSEVSGTLR